MELENLGKLRYTAKVIKTWLIFDCQLIFVSVNCTALFSGWK